MIWMAICSLTVPSPAPMIHLTGSFLQAVILTLTMLKTLGGKMKFICIAFLCFLSIAILFITTEIIPRKVPKTVTVLLSMAIGLLITFISMYFIIQLGKKWNMYDETKLLIMLFGGLLLVVDAIHLFFQNNS